MKKWQNIITGLTSITILAMNLALTKRLLNESDEITEEEIMNGSFLHLTKENGILLFSLFLFIAVSSLVLALLFRHEKCRFMQYLVYAALSVGSCVVLAVQGHTQRSFQLASILFIAGIAIGRIIAVICGHSKLNLLVVLFLVLFSVLFWIVPAYSFVMNLLVIDVYAILQVAMLTFSRIRMDILKRIIKRTYAAEILAGIVLLIVAFSLFMPLFEENIPTFQDALWYCFAIVTTIGFGDITATSAVGRIMSVILGIYGIIVVALITSVIVNFYGEIRKEDEHEDEQEQEEKKVVDEQGV